MQTPQSDLLAGDVVRLRGRHWRVLRIAAGRDCSSLQVQLLQANGTGRDGPQTFLLPFDRPMKLARNRRPLVVGRRRWVRALRAVLQDAPPWDGLQTAAGARLMLFPWQLEPCLALLHGRCHRVLIADEVGMGKTIQAGLILSELQQRGEAARVLVVTPAGLCDQWAGELHGRFDITVDVVDAEWIRRRISVLPHSLNPWSLPGVRVTSLDYVKQPEVLQASESVLWDLLVVDEAHLAASGTGRGAAVAVLGRAARRVVLLTATPYSGRDEPFAALCDLGRLDRHAAADPILIFRRSRKDAGLAVTRRTRVLRVAPTPAERRMHDLLAHYTGSVWREAGRQGRQDARLAMVVLRKRALSSARSLAVSLDRRLRLLEPAADTAVQLSLALWKDDSGAGDEEPVSALRAAGLADAAKERAWLNAILSAAVAAARAGESKCLALARLLRRSTEPIIVFTEYRDTLQRLARLAPAADVLLLHGGRSREERQDTVHRFNTGAGRLLLATDAAGEGLNLQATCRWVVNYELPWNPLRLLQRIGRVDRLGQSRTVHALHLVARDTPELDLLLRLHSRIERVRAVLDGTDDAIGGMSEEQVAMAIMEGGTLPPQPSSIRSPAVMDCAPRTRHVTRDADFRRPSAELRQIAVAECQRIERIRGLRASPCRRNDRRRHRPGRLPADRRMPVVHLIGRQGTLRLMRRLLATFRLRTDSGFPDKGARLRVATVCVCRVTIGPENGSAVESVLVPVIASERSAFDPRPDEPRAERRVALRGPESVRPRDIASDLTSWLRRYDSHLRDICRREAERRIEVLQSRYATALRARAHRETLLAAHLDQRARNLWQPGLFERRAERRNASERAVREAAWREIEWKASPGSERLTVVGEVEVILVLGLAARSQEVLPTHCSAAEKRAVAPTPRS